MNLTKTYLASVFLFNKKYFLCVNLVSINSEINLFSKAEFFMGILQMTVHKRINYLQLIVVFPGLFSVLLLTVNLYVKKYQSKCPWETKGIIFSI